MVGGIGGVPARPLRAVAGARLRATLRLLPGPARSALARRVLQSLVTVDRAAALDVVAAHLAHGEWTAAERQRLLASSLATPDRGAALDALTAHLARGEWTAAERERLFASSCELLAGAGIPDKAIQAFESASGAAVHYSQEGEDIVLARLLGATASGFYVDVGAHHATRFSNTYALYRKGWRGLNIDATPGSMESFRRLRPEDINVEAAVSDRREPLVFSLFKEGALNTFDPALARSYVEGGWEPRGSVEIVPQTLASLLERHLAPGQQIDLLSVDVEGEDLAVLRSNDWSRYCPRIVIVEALDTPLASLDRHCVVAFLKDQGYVPVARLVNSIIFNRADRVCAAS
jgi:FkbM family methyltransferase